MKIFTNLVQAQDNARMVNLLKMSQDSLLKRISAQEAKIREQREEIYDNKYGENELMKKIARLEGKPYLTAKQAQAINDKA